jgi:hypothetical protein
VNAGGGTEVDDAVGARHELVVVLDHEQRVALGAQGLERVDQAVVVAGVQADARLVEHVEHAGEVGAELGGEADALGLAAGERLGGAVEREVAEADMVEELQALLDLRHDVLRDEPAAGVEFEGAQVGEQLRGRGARAGAGRESGAAAAEVEFDRAADAVEAFAVAFGAGEPVSATSSAESTPNSRRRAAGSSSSSSVGLEHPGEDAAVAAAGGTPAARRVEGEIFRVEFGKTLAGLDVGAGGGEPGEDLPCGVSRKQAPLPARGGGGSRAGPGGRPWPAGRVGLQVGDDDFDVVLLVAVEFLEGVDARQAAVGAHEFVALIGDPGGDGLVVALAAADQRGAEVEVFGPARRAWRHAREQGASVGRARAGDGFVRVGVMLHAEAGVEEAQVLGDLGDGGDGGLARAAGDALLDGDGGRDAGEAVDGGARELFDELPRVGRHRLHETALALGEHDVEGEGGFAGAGDAGDDGELPVRMVSERFLRLFSRAPVMVTAIAERRRRLLRLCRWRSSGGGGFGGEEGQGSPAARAARRNGAVAVSAEATSLGRALGDDAAAVGAGFGADLDDPVGGFEDVEVVLDHDDAVTAVDEGVEDGEEALDVVAVEAGGGFVEQQQRAPAAGRRPISIWTWRGVGRCRGSGRV